MNSDSLIPSELTALRSSIDNLDASLIFILSERFKLTQKVGQLKTTMSCWQQTPPEKTSRSRGCASWPTMRSSPPCSWSAS